MNNQSFERLWACLNLRRKKQLALLLVIMIATSTAEVVSIGAVLPFLGAIFSPEKLFQSDYLQGVMAALEITNSDQLLLPLTLMFIGVALIAGLMRLILLWAQTRIGHAIGADLSIQIYEKTLYQPYAVHVSRNSSEMIAGISNKVNIVVGSTILPLLMIASSLILLVGILAALIAIHSYVAFAAFFVFGIVYALVMVLTRKHLIRNSERISTEHVRVVKALQEGLGGIRDVLIDGTQAVYCKIYQSADLRLRGAQANNQIIGTSPRFLIEAFGITLIATLAYVLAGREGGASAAIPLLGALAIGAQRLLPVLQQFYSSWSSLRGAEASLSDVLSLLDQPLPTCAQEISDQKIQFSNSIKLENISFRYSDEAPWVLKNISIEILKNTRVGFIGTTGSGKSTLLDVLMGLLMPEQGGLLVDNIFVNQKNFRAWHAHISHVPQAIFLADTTIAENIAFGVPLDKIDFDLVKESARRAQIAGTVESWEYSYSTYVGERGVRLSGGQRQRIGIARALYKQADIIIFDEATSSLDTETEAAVMNSIDTISTEITILMVAHRLSTLRACDVIYELEDGKIKRSGSYQELFQIQ